MESHTLVLQSCAHNVRQLCHFSEVDETTFVVGLGGYFQGVDGVQVRSNVRQGRRKFTEGGQSAVTGRNSHNDYNLPSFSQCFLSKPVGVER